MLPRSLSANKYIIINGAFVETYKISLCNERIQCNVASFQDEVMFSFLHADVKLFVCDF